MLTQEIKVNEVRKKKEPRGGNEENYYGKSIASGDISTFLKGACLGALTCFHISWPRLPLVCGANLGLVECPH